MNPHRFPTPAPTGELIAWKCRACGEWVGEFGSDPTLGCSVDWRASDESFGPDGADQ